MNGAHSHILVIGLGATGWACVRHLADRGSQITVWDDRELPPFGADLISRFPAVDYEFGEFPDMVPETVTEVVVSPGIDARLPMFDVMRAANQSVIGDIELFVRECAAPVIAVTGSNGKSTVVAAVAEMARQAGINAAIGGNFGTPAVDLLDSTIDLYVLELSSFQLEWKPSLKPLAATVLNLSADHLDRHDSLEAYRDIKFHVFADSSSQILPLTKDGSAVLDALPALSNAQYFSEGLPSSERDYGVIEKEGESWLAQGDAALMPVKELALLGAHSISNALAALALAEAAGLDRAACLQALKTFTGLPHRCQHVASIAGVNYINDSKGTNVGATLAAIDSLKGPLVLLCGGQAKGAEFSSWRPVLADKGRAALVFGQDAEQIITDLDASVPVERHDTLDAAFHSATQLAMAGDTVLLSPGCASFDQFPSYLARGDRFVELVTSLSRSSASGQRMNGGLQ